MLNTRVLDVSETGGRVAKDFPLLPVCHIPLATLLKSRHRLPAPRQEVWILDAAEAPEAASWVKGLGRQARVIPALESPPEARGELWAPGLAAQDLLAHSTPGDSVLDLGCGSGRDSVFLAAHDRRVTAVDRLEKLLNEGRRLEQDVLRSEPTIRWLTAAPDEAFDHILIAYAFRRELMQFAVQHLNPQGGKIWLEGHSITHFQCFGNPSIDLCLSRNGLSQYGFVTQYREVWRSDRHSAVAAVINIGDNL